jgi:hypothetical protein
MATECRAASAAASGWWTKWRGGSRRCRGYFVAAGSGGEGRGTRREGELDEGRGLRRRSECARVFETRRRYSPVAFGRGPLVGWDRSRSHRATRGKGCGMSAILRAYDSLYAMDDHGAGTRTEAKELYVSTSGRCDQEVCFCRQKS